MGRGIETIKGFSHEKSLGLSRYLPSIVMIKRIGFFNPSLQAGDIATENCKGL